MNPIAEEILMHYGIQAILRIKKNLFRNHFESDSIIHIDKRTEKNVSRLHRHKE